MELCTACAKIATIGEYYKLRARSTRPTYVGIVGSFLGTIAIVAALTGLIHQPDDRNGGSISGRSGRV